MRRSRFLGLTLALTTTCFLGATTPAFADAESDAKDLFVRARELRSRGDCAGASPLFYKAWRTYPQGLGNLRNYAECEEQLGHFASSRRAWLDLKRALLTAPHDSKYESWDKDADDAAMRLKPKVAQLTVDVVVKTPESEGPANEKSGVELLINGEPIATNLIGTPLERDPGTYTVRLQAPDAQPVEQGVALAAGDTRRMSLRIVRTPKDAAGAGVVSGYPDAGSSRSSGRKTAGFVMIGVGAAALIGSGVTFLLRQSALDDLEKLCGADFENRCVTNDTARQRDIVDKGSLMSTLSPVLLGVGLVGVGAGIVLVATAPKDSRTGVSSSVQVGLGRVDALFRF